jgi:heterotetrameric sarcosine oxidase delta subunit
MQLNCPFCGPRDEAEFTYGGDASQTLMPAAGTATIDWLTQIYLRDNPRGLHDEVWFHASGCHRWLRVHRSTVDHTIESVRPAGRARAGGAA